MNDGLGRPQTVLVLGAGSDIAAATVRRLVARGSRRFVLAGRKPERFEAEADELRRVGAEVHVLQLDLDDLGAHDAFVERAFDIPWDIDLVLLAAGVLGEQALAERDGATAAALLRTNLVGPVSLLTPIAVRLRTQGHGWIVVLSSVAAERARAANYVYGASKAGLDAFAQGLGDRLAGSGPRVLVVRPGFVRTKMTAGRRPAPLATTPEAVAAAVVAGVRSGARIVWVPRQLRWAMSALRHLPHPLFLRITAQEHA